MILSKNLHRRHLGKSQLALAAGRAQKLREKYEEAAKERQHAGQQSGGRGHKKNLVEQVTPSLVAGKSRDHLGVQFGVSGPTVDRGRRVVEKGVPELDKDKAVKAALTHPNGAKMSNRQIAEYIGVSEFMVRKHREDAESTAILSQSPERTGRDGRTIDTTNIGKSNPQNAGLIIPSPTKVCGDSRGGKCWPRATVRGGC